MIPSIDFHFTSTDGLRVACARWDSRPPVRGVVQIAHSMGEHIGRYGGLIEVLVDNGLTVYGNDHRGHGRTAISPAHFGHFGEGGFDYLVQDMVRLSGIAKAENPGQPLVLLGHGMGSFAAQQYVLDHSREVDALVLSGSGALDGFALLASATPAGTNILNMRFVPARTPFDWLSRDRAVVDAFINDPLCFAALQPQALSSLFAAAHPLSDPTRLLNIRDDLPVYVFSGTEDPVGQQLEGVRVLTMRYESAGLYDIYHEFYPGGRHEMLNETNREEVQTDLLGWISAVLERQKEGWFTHPSIA